jgi:HemY protein
VSTIVAVQAANAFIKIGQQIEASSILEAALTKTWDSRLLRAYRQVAAPAGSSTLLKQIEHCEHWLKERPNDTEISLALGVLCLKQKLWGKAQRHLEQSLSGSDLSTRQEAHLRLAQLHEELNQPEAAADHYRQCAVTLLPLTAKS